MWGFNKDHQRDNMANSGKAKKTTKKVKKAQTDKANKRHGGTGNNNAGKH